MPYPQPPCPNRTITFTLQGRHTLSENLPSETISVSIPTICRSQHLSSLAQISPSSSTPIPLPTIDPAAFKIYMTWLEKGHISFPFTNAQLRDCIDLLYAHVLGGKFEELQFREDILRALIRGTDAVQTPDLMVLQMVFLEDGVDEGLKRWVVERVFAHEKRMLRLIRRQYRGGEDGIEGVGEGEGERRIGEDEWDWLNGNTRERPCEVSEAQEVVRKSDVEKALPPTPNSRPDPCRELDIKSGLLVANGAQMAPKAIGTFQLIAECLERYSTSSGSLASNTSAINSPSYISNGDTSKAEILATLARSMPDLTPRPLTRNTPSLPDPCSPSALRDSVSTLTTRAPGAMVQDPSGELWFTTPQTMSPVSAMISIMTIKRKPASLRGLDWFEQYDRVNPPTSSSKQPKRRISKFREHV